MDFFTAQFIAIVCIYIYTAANECTYAFLSFKFIKYRIKASAPPIRLLSVSASARAAPRTSTQKARSETFCHRLPQQAAFLSPPDREPRASQSESRRPPIS